MPDGFARRNVAVVPTPGVTVGGGGVHAFVTIASASTRTAALTWIAPPARGCRARARAARRLARAARGGEEPARPVGASGEERRADPEPDDPSLQVCGDLLVRDVPGGDERQ